MPTLDGPQQLLVIGEPSHGVDGLKVPEESILKTIEILEQKKIGKKSFPLALCYWCSIFKS